MVLLYRCEVQGEMFSCTAQGTSQTMEDALELGRQVALHGPTEEALRAYEAIRCGRLHGQHCWSESSRIALP